MIRPPTADFVLRNAGELVTCAPRYADGLGAVTDGLPACADGLGVIPKGALAAAAGRVVWVGPTSALDEAVTVGPHTEVLDAGGRVVMPGLVECHTHLVFGGDRAAEFQLRVAGKSYTEIAEAGGGIRSTVAATRAASREELVERGRRNLDSFLRFGVTTLEAKSGYGLTVDHEIRLLEIYRELDATHAVDVVSTLLAAHVVPPEYAGDADGYVDLIVGELIPEVARRRLAVFCDAFCEQGAFTLEQCRRVLEAGRAHGLRPKLHADQLTNGGGAELAAGVGAVSADHLDRVSPAGIAAMAAAGVTAVLLPGAVFFLGLHDFSPARDMVAAGVRVALSTDFNPGTCYTENVFLMGTIASAYQHLEVREVLLGLTYNAACALGLQSEVGSLEAGKRADLVVLNAERHEEIPYHFGVNPVRSVIKGGRVVVKEGVPVP